jgi:hypothetical protein
MCVCVCVYVCACDARKYPPASLVGVALQRLREGESEGHDHAETTRTCYVKKKRKVRKQTIQ